MEMIQRYAHFSRAVALGAGVYFGVGAVTITAQFNLVVNSFSASCFADDDVTAQALEMSARYPLNIAGGGGNSNPGLKSTTLDNPIFYAHSAGPVCNVPMHLYITALDTITVSVGASVYTVTANAVSTISSFALGYLCPKDYLSVEPFLG